VTERIRAAVPAPSTDPAYELDTVGIGYTLATGRLFCNWIGFTFWAEDVLGRPILFHEFADSETWDELREAFESLALARGGAA
jgi:hypothetical protein